MLRNRQHHGQYIHDRMEDLYERGSEAGARLGEMMENAGDVLQRQLQPVGQTVRDYPLSSLFVAIGLGAILGAFFLRR